MLDKQKLEQLAGSLARLGGRRLALLAIVGVAVAMAVGLAATYLGRPAMQPIYTGLSAQDVARMTAALAEAGVAFDVNEQRNAILVPFGQTTRARTLLAQRGLPTSSRAGYELFDQMGSIGLTSFMQEVTRVRALEGEIARTIQGLDGVSAARVHLVLPEAGSLRRERRESSASVLLRIDGRWQSAASHTVRHIVAAAVPGMKLEQVSVASTDGRLLASGGDEKTQGSQRLAEMERSMAAELEQRAGRTLASTLGAGNYQVSATVRLDVDRQQINETVFDPKSRVERSVRVVKQSGSSEDGGGRPAVGVEANIPREEGSQAEGDRRRQREDRREELVNYELNSKTVQIVREGYRIQRLAIAVVVNRKQIAAQLGGNADRAAIDARLGELRRLIGAATGASLEREDSIEISAVDLDLNDAKLAPAPFPGVLDHVMMHLGTIINAVAMIAVVLIVLAFGMRPALRALGRTDAQQPVQAEPSPLGIASQQSAAVPSAGAMPGLEAAAAPARPIAAAAIAPPAGSDAAMRERLEALVAADEAKVAGVFKAWIAEARQS